MVLLDASTYQLFSTFASNQTGNVILLAVGASGIMEEHTTTLYNGISLAGYLIFGFVFGHLGNAAGPRRRWWLLTSHVAQLVLLVCVLALTWTRVFPSTRAQWPLLLLLAMSSGIQVAQARTSGIQELPTAMLSSPMVDLVVDPHLWKLSLSDPSVQPRNRRAMHVAAMSGGAFAGAFLHKASGAEASILVACVIKLVIAFALVFVKGERRQEPKDVEKAMGSERSRT
ncbi:hypothetical protein QFC22_002488 [Naganishia vaughanmartiniae]|uniref:Uncharacterized protein n=1 Tax=Naganishia vaughanmartiniae TaxID=1424756 RepID=A0ACC2XE54_9TREE|nr:hypothetical protein QFC22_002488 [Naganishia vaughanmartiniae]